MYPVTQNKQPSAVTAIVPEAVLAATAVLATQLVDVAKEQAVLAGEVKYVSAVVYKHESQSALAVVEAPVVPAIANPVAQEAVAATQTLCDGLFQNPSSAVEVDDILHVNPDTIVA